MHCNSRRSYVSYYVLKEKKDDCFSENNNLTHSLPFTLRARVIFRERKKRESDDRTREVIDWFSISAGTI